MAVQYTAPAPIVVQQTWGTNVAGAIERMAARKHQEELLKEQLEYQKSRDAVQDSHWDKEFEMTSNMAQTKMELLGVELSKSQNDLIRYKSDNEALINQNVMQENKMRVDTQNAANIAERKRREKELAELKQAGSNWFGHKGKGGLEATSELNIREREAGTASLMSRGMSAIGADPVYDFLDWMGGTEGEYNIPQQLEAELQTSETYKDPTEIYQSIQDQGGGYINPETMGNIYGQDPYAANRREKMQSQDLIKQLIQNLGGGYGGNY